MAPIGRVTDLTEVQSIREFLGRNGLLMTGMRRASKSVMENGYPKEEHVVVFKEGAYASVSGPAFLFEDGEKDRIIDDLRTTVLPVPIPFTNASMSNDAPPEIKGTKLDPRAWKNVDWSKDDVLCPIHDENGNVVMIEQRYRDADGEKICVRWSYHDDFTWRHQDPEKFPFWGMDQLNDGASTVFLHEGPKSASAGRRFYQLDANRIDDRDAVKAHPWYPVLSKFPHLGWIGGANRADRTNWRYLKKIGVKRVIIIPDNDSGGRDVAYTIAEFLTGIEVKILPEYPAGWPVGWDVADSFEGLPEGWEDLPKNLIDITRYYKMVHAGTKADPNKRRAVPLEEYPKNIAYIKELDKFIVNSNHKNLIAPGPAVGRQYSENLHPTLIEKYHIHSVTRKGVSFDRLAFKPLEGLVLYQDAKKLMNIWRPTTVEEVMMDARGKRIFNWYLRQIAPDPLERAIIRRWIATTIVKPNRLYFGMILHSTQQGTGKGILVNKVFSPLIGPDYIARPDAETLGNRFTDWALNSTLIFADEIKAIGTVTTGQIYNKFKPFITEPWIRIEGKGEKVYWIENFSKTLVASNGNKPLHMEQLDRRWFVSATKEREMLEKRFKVIDRWLQSGGLGQILWWARRIEDDSEAVVTDGMLDDLGPDGKRSFTLSMKAEFIPNGANAPKTISKIKMLKRSMPMWFSKMEEFVDILTTDHRTTETDQEWDVLDDKPQKPWALPMPVFVQAIQDYCKQAPEINRLPSKEEIEQYLPKVGLYIAPIKKLASSPKDLVVATQMKINKHHAGRYSVVMNREAVQFAIDRGFIDGGDVDERRMTYLTVKNPKGRREFGPMLSVMREQSVFRPQWMWIREDERRAGFHSADGKDDDEPIVHSV
ncbi:DUF5906 domain-containing protein [Shimia thalassica]|uniref:primase-helicase family protein n=1 Tax=Shimia thalassica TaxID=1715693 RepID=UPI002734BC7B|nr:DUF5906 domain-containing protein [Shimia thalassica]MDP2495485.1 DUF5906 domain-containing protein [Shimia thalassica]